MLLSIKESLWAKTLTCFAKNVKNLQNMHFGIIKQVFTSNNGILVVKLVGIDTKIKVLSFKTLKSQPKMFILTTVHAIAREDH